MNSYYSKKLYSWNNYDYLIIRRILDEYHICDDVKCIILQYSREIYNYKIYVNILSFYNNYYYWNLCDFITNDVLNEINKQLHFSNRCFLDEYKNFIPKNKKYTYKRVTKFNIHDCNYDELIFIQNLFKKYNKCKDILHYNFIVNYDILKCKLLI